MGARRLGHVAKRLSGIDQSRDAVPDAAASIDGFSNHDRRSSRTSERELSGQAAATTRTQRASQVRWGLRYRERREKFLFGDIRRHV